MSKRTCTITVSFVAIAWCGFMLGAVGVSSPQHTHHLYQPVMEVSAVLLILSGTLFFVMKEREEIS